MTAHADRLSGVFLPVTTPFNQDMNVDYGALKADMQFYAASGVHGYLALGSNGENRSLSETEKLRVLETIIAHRASNQIVMTGCIYDSTLLTIDFMRFAQSVGSDYATLLSPSYFRQYMTHDVLVEYFTECADSVVIPVLLYNAPGFTGVTLSPETVAVLAKHPNIVGMKDSASAGIENFCPLNGPKFSVLAGSANFFYPSMALGVRGGIVSLANAFPEAGLTLWKNGLQGQTPEGHAFHQRMNEANRRISGRYGVPGVKAAMDLAGLVGGYPRRPLRRLEGEDREAVGQALREAGLLS